MNRVSDFLKTLSLGMRFIIGFAMLAAALGGCYFQGYRNEQIEGTFDVQASIIGFVWGMAYIASIVAMIAWQLPSKAAAEATPAIPAIVEEEESLDSLQRRGRNLQVIKLPLVVFSALMLIGILWGVGDWLDLSSTRGTAWLLPTCAFCLLASTAFLLHARTEMPSIARQIQQREAGKPAS